MFSNIILNYKNVAIFGNTRNVGANTLEVVDKKIGNKTLDRVTIGGTL